jgi:hypothetical protein
VAQIRSRSASVEIVAGRANVLVLVFVVVLGLSGCGRKADVHVQARELEQVFQASPSNPYVSLALSAARTNDIAVSAMALQNARRMPGLTPDQLLAVQRTLEAITADLVARAEKGDAKARAALAAIERSRSQ